MKKIKKMKIFYVGYYDLIENSTLSESSISFAAVRKMNYILSVVSKNSNNIEIVSPIISSRRRANTFKSEKIEKKIKLSMAPFVTSNNKVIKKIGNIWGRSWMHFYLMFSVKKEDMVICYHSPYYAKSLLFLQKLVGFKLVPEIEEIYSEIWSISEKLNKAEENMLEFCKKNIYLTVSDLLEKKIGGRAIISYGSYQTYKGVIEPKNMNREVVLVFTGSIERVRGGAFQAVESMNYLTDSYILKISGKGDLENVKDLKKEIEKVNNRKQRKACEYVGMLSDIDYQEFLLNADIALNPQIKGNYDEFLFPSKILTYFSYNIPVVSTKGESIVKSSLQDIIYFADDYTPESFAKAISRVEIKSDIDYRNNLKKLDKNFELDLRALVTNYERN